MASRENEKAIRYITQLEQARCNGRWDEIPELTRKVLKHAPSRKCLVLTAQTEMNVANYIPSERPSTAATTGSTPSSPVLAKLITPLLSAIDEEQTHLEDAFQATTCLCWIHWVLNEPQLAIARLPKDIAGSLTKISEGQHQSKAWVAVCALKAAYIKGFSLEKTVGLEEGLEAYTSILPYLLSQPLSLGSYSPEFRLWAERMLSRMVAVSMKSKPLGDLLDLETMLQMFHMWISLFKYTPTNPKLPIPHEPARQAPSMIELGAEVDYSRWDVWMAYYDTLSEILTRGLVYGPMYTEKHPQLLEDAEELADSDLQRCKLRQRTELKQVEASIETKLLEETRFPKATERNSRVERWVDAVMQNWRILCGPSWQDSELGEGGKNAIARGVLDILYRAATKSFHSTQILRFLFNVHAYLTEFDLAFRSFDTYVELVQKGKDREEKTGQPDYSLDNDDTSLHTVSEAVRILCRYGDRKDIEKARSVSERLQQWLQKATAEAEAQETVDPTINVPTRIPVSPKYVAESYRALGICEATWARITYDPSTRNLHQQKAVDLLRTSLKISFNDESDLETSYQLAMVLAEMRDLPAAVKVVKQAMSRPLRGDLAGSFRSNGSLSTTSRSEPTDFHRERKLVPFWHLLTLLLTAKADLGTAARTSNAAFEQFDDQIILFGTDSQYKSEHLQELEKPQNSSAKALVDRMERFEKDGIIQVKLTQIAIKETLQNAADAVESSAELLALYARLFGDPRSDFNYESQSRTAKPPKSSVSTLRNTVFSRIGRSRSRHGGKPASLASVPSVPSPRPATVATTATTAPTIQVTNEDGRATRSKNKTLDRSPSHHSAFRSRSQHGGLIRSPSTGKLQKRSGSQSRKSVESSRPASTYTTHTQNGISSTDHATSPTQSETKVSNFSLPRPSTSTTAEPSSLSPTQPLREIPHNLDRTSEPPPPGQHEQPPKQDVRLPAPHPSSGQVTPEPLFPIIQERKHKMSLLIDLWLFIAGMYTRAEVYDDAKAAIDEAAELVQIIESQVAVETSSAKAFATRGWGGGKSVEELWADVYNAKGDLANVESTPYDALAYYEKALSHFPDHPAGIVGLSNLLLDIASEKIPPEEPEPPLFPPSLSEKPISLVAKEIPNTSKPDKDTPIRPTLTKSSTNVSTKTSTSASTTLDNPTTPSNNPSNSLSLSKMPKEPSPEELNRLAARDRAYGLLSSLTKLGTGWDYSEAWYALARSYELSGQVEKAKEVLWWCVELEDTRPVRNWSCVRFGGF